MDQDALLRVPPDGQESAALLKHAEGPNGTCIITAIGHPMPGQQIPQVPLTVVPVPPTVPAQDLSNGNCGPKAGLTNGGAPGGSTTTMMTTAS